MAIGRVDPTSQDASLYVVHYLASTPIDVLATVQAPVFKDAWREPHALAIKADERRGGRLTSRQPVGLVNGIGQGLPQPVALPVAKVVVHRRPRRKAAG